MRKGKGIVSLLLAALIVLGGIGTAGMATAEGLSAQTYTHGLYGTLYSPGNSIGFQIAEDIKGIVSKIPTLYQLIIKDGRVSPDYEYEWVLSEGAKKFRFIEDDGYVNLDGTIDQIEDAKTLVDKTVFTLNIFKKSDKTPVATFNCVLKGLYYPPEWNNYNLIEKDFYFTPGKPLTISLPQDKIASTYDKENLIYEWNGFLNESQNILSKSGKDLTSITITPAADWDGALLFIRVYREDLPEEPYDLWIEYTLRKETGATGTAPKTGDETPLAMLTALLGLSLLGLAVLLVRRRRSA
mgnify:CR=1 FL=1